MTIKHVLILLAAVLLLAACATPGDMASREDAPTVEESDAPEAAPEQDTPQRATGSELSPVAANLLASAQGLLNGGDTDGALNLAQRAHRISPDAAEVYFQLGEIHMARGDYARAEQFVLKGIDKAGNNESQQRTGWQMLVDIRESDGDMAGAREAEQRAANL